MSGVILYDYWRSSASYRVRIALHLAGIDYTSVAVDLLADEHHSAAHLARNPQGRVPVLDIDGQRFTQSLAIIEYLDATRGLGLLARDPAVAARQRAAAHVLAIDVHPICNLGVVAYAAALTGRDETKEAWMRHFIRPGLEAFEALLGSFAPARFSTGATPSLADICLVPQLYNARRWGIAHDDLPRLSAAASACAELPAFAAAHPDRHRPAG